MHSNLFGSQGQEQFALIMANMLTKEVAEVNELKAKVAEFDAMKEQFVLIMANMQNHGSNIGSPFEVRRSSESSHNVEGDQATPDD
ncbi:hypothetical protein QL285_026334 [Trifolium repens]|nr:hypothetical protein QL285_046317 [Trifolium repens]KAK2427775.1 hypothetical protein QL285_026334 [Trifolium repens]